jgi:hypothetical protein
MANQLKKKFLGNDQVDGDKIKLEQGQSIRAVDSSNNVVDLVKLGVSDEVLVNGDEVALKSNLDQEIIDRAAGDASTLSSAEAYTDQKIADLVDAAPALLDTLNELAAALGDDPNFVTTVTGLISDVQSNLDQEILDRAADVDAEQSRAEGAEAALQSDINDVADDVSHLVILSGVAVDSDDLGSFTGSTIADNQTIKEALQDLETAHEEVDANVNDLISLSGVVENSADLGAFTGTTIPDSQTIKQALQALETAVESVSGGGSSTQLELDATQVGAGLDTDGSYIVNGAANYISASSSLADADNDLDAAIKVVADDLAQEIIDRGAADDLKVSKAGDTMTGTLIINPVSGNAAELLDLDIGVPSWGPNYLAVALQDGSPKQLYVGSADQLGAFAGTASKKALFASGFSSGAASGVVQVASGDAQISGNSGQVDVFSGNAVGGISGAARLLSGTGGSSSGNAVVGSGAAQNTGAVVIQSGNASAGNSGNVFIYTGTATGTKGSILINTQMNFQSAGRITNLQDAVSAQDAVTKAQLDAHINDASGAHAASAISVSPVGNLAADDVQEALQELQVDIDSLNALQDDYVVLDGSRPMTGNLNMMPSLGVHNKIVGLGDPTDARDAVNKQYVDAIAEGLHVHAPAKLLASADLGGTYDNGVSGVGAFLDLSAAPVASIDGVSSFSVGDRIIVAFQNGSNLDAENGIYYIAASADIDGNGDIIKLTRALDFNTPTEMAGGDFIFVQSGSQYANTGWVMSETVTTVGTTPVKFVQFSGAGTYSAGDALDLTGTEFSVRVDNTTIIVNANNDLEIAPSVMTDLADKVSKAGDTMTGNLTLDQSIGVTAVVSPQSIVFSDTALQSVYQLAHGSGFSASFTDNTSITVTSEFYEGAFDLGATSLDSSAANGSLSADALAGIQISKVDFVDDNSSNLVLNSKELVFDLTDNATGNTYSSAFQHNAIVLGVQDVSGVSQFQVFPNQPVQNMASDGSAPAPTLDTHLTSKKYVDDSIAAHVDDASDAHDASAISLSPAINGQSDVQSALADHESRIDVLESVVWFKESFPISNGQTSVTLSHTPETNSMSAWVDRLAIHEGAAEDYTILGTTMTFLNDLVSPGQSQIGAGDTIYVKYQYKV